MEAEWEPVLMDIVAYKETGAYIVRSGEETAQMLDDHIVMTQAMSSPLTRSHLKAGSPPGRIS